MAIPLYWTVLSKAGNSSTQERIDLLERFFNQFPSLSIEALVADREFIGQKWFSYLKEKDFHFVMRLRSNFKAKRKGTKKTVKEWCRGLSISETYQLEATFIVNGVAVYLSVSRTEKGYVYLASPVFVEVIFQIYKQRWEIDHEVALKVDTIQSTKNTGIQFRKY